MQKGQVLIFLIVGILILAAIGGMYFFQKREAIKKISSFEECNKAGYQVFLSYPGKCHTPDGRSFIEPISEENKKKLQSPSSSDETANWKTFSNNNYSFKYPVDWSIQDQPKDSTNRYSEVVNIKNLSGSVAIILSPFQYPYGLEGEDIAKSIQTNDLTVTIEGNQYLVKETTFLKNKAFVDMKVQRTKEHHILFGTGYPAAEDKLASLSDYKSNRNLILKMLSTLKIAE